MDKNKKKLEESKTEKCKENQKLKNKRKKKMLYSQKISFHLLNYNPTLK